MTTTVRKPRPAKKTGDPQADRVARGESPLPEDLMNTYMATYFLAKDNSFQVHLRTCATGKKAAARNGDDPTDFEIASKADAISQLETREGEVVTFHPTCLKTLPDSVQPDEPVADEPATDTTPDKAAVKRMAKQALARRVVQAVAASVAALSDASAVKFDDDELAILSGMSPTDALQFAANWLHHLPTGDDESGRIWPTDQMPKPDRADWK